MKMDEVNSEEYWHDMIKWKWNSECVCHEPCDEMEDDECGDEMRQW